MNANLFRLVFNRRLGMYVPAHEAARSQGKKGGRAMTAAAVTAALLVSLPAMAQLPVACGGAACGVNPNPVNFVTSGAAGYAVNGTQGIVTQTTNKAILNWQSFNVGAGYSMVFNQPGANSAALNRIWQADPSVIAGILQSNGHIYLINQNGILFANGAQVNVGSLTATSLDITDQTFNDGILADLNRPPVFQGTSGFVRVEEGATLTAASGGRIMLLAPAVENAGLIQTSDGQAILAAGQKVYLNDTLDPAGVMVEVDSGGTVTNLGQIIAERGNVSLVGLAVNQMGRITATTSVRSGGSIFLRARDTVDTSLLDGTADPDGDGNQGERTLRPTRTGTVVLGKDSVTEVMPELNDKEEILDLQSFSPSRVEIQGRTVQIDGSILAPGGIVDVSAVYDPRVIDKDGNYSNTTAYQHYSDAGVRIYVGETALIDVSGLGYVPLPMEDHQLAVKLYSEQVKDAPLLRGGPLFGQVVYLDDRVGTGLFDYSAAAALNGKTVAEKLTAGGSVALKSEGSLITRQGSVIDLSGGSVQYAGGYIKTTQLTYQGEVIDIAEATPDIPYDGIVGVYSAFDPKWGVYRSWDIGSGGQGTFHAGYVEGKDAGKLTTWAPAGFAFEGTLRSETTIGELQHIEPPRGASLVMGQQVDINRNLMPAEVRIVQDKVLLPDDFAVTDVLLDAYANQLATSSLADGFGDITVHADQTLTVDAPVNVNAEGSASFIALNVLVNADINAAGGSIVLDGGNITVADGVKLNAAGMWTNDRPGVQGSSLAPIALDGGAITIKGTGSVAVGENSLLDVSAGAWHTASGDLETGKAGEISITADTLDMEGELSGYGFSEGGDLTIKVKQNIQIGGADPGGDWFWLPESFFQQGGFTSYDVSAPGLNNGLFRIGDGSPVDVLARAQNYVIGQNLLAMPSTASLREMAQVALLPETYRAPVSLKFAAATSGGNIGNLIVEQGSRILTEAGGGIELTAGDQLWVLGKLETPAGSIKLTLSEDTSQFDDSRTIWIGDAASLSATGYFKADPLDGSGLVGGELMSGGDVIINAKKGYVVLQEGAEIDVSGTSAEVDIPVPGGYSRQTLAGDAGSIRLSAREGFLLDGDLRGEAGGEGAAGGRLVLALTGTDPRIANDFNLPVGGRVLSVTQDYSQSAAGLAPGDSLPTAVYGGQGRISAEQINAGGFDALSLASYFVSRAAQTGQDRVDFVAGLDFTVPGAIYIDAPLVNVSGAGDVALNTSYLQIANESGVAASTGALVSSPGNELRMNAGWIDLNGQLAIGGAENVVMNSSLDIRARGRFTSIRPDGSHVVNGWLNVPGDLALIARQIYPASASDFRFESLGMGNTLTIERAMKDGVPTSHVPVLSAGGGLVFKAGNILQAGVVKAPLGDVVFDAADNLTLAEGSLTSVSAEGQIIPFGFTVLGGREWRQQPDSGNAIEFQEPRDKKIQLKGDVINQAEGAIIDVSGGGDLMAYEWVNGIYGSEDILAAKGVYAVLPGIKDGYAPFDWDYSKGTDLQPGDAVFLSGVPGLEAGYYTLLPARYALLPGAYLVRPQSGTTDMQSTQNLTQPDGSTLVAGYRLNLATQSRDARQSGFNVISGEIFLPVSGQIYKGPSEYVLTYANDYFPALAAYNGEAVPRLPMDAGHLVLNASNSLALDGNLVAGSGEGGRGALVDIVSTNIRVVSQIGPDDGTLQLEAGALNELGAESLMLGGVRSFDADGVRIDTAANSVSFENDAAHPLEGLEILAVAGDSLNVGEGAVLMAHSGEQPGEAQTLLLSGEGTLIRLSGLADATILREGVGATPTRGDLLIGTGSLLKAGRALALDATRNLNYAGSIELDEGAAAYFGARRISLGEPGFAVEGLLFSSDDLAALGNLSRLTLNSNSTLDLYGGVLFGNGSLDLVIQSAGIAGYANNGLTAQLIADSVTLANPNSRPFTPALGQVVGDGGLGIEANRIELGLSGIEGVSQDLRIAGFADVVLSTPGEISAVSPGALTLEAGNVTLTSSRITTSSGVGFLIEGVGSNMILDRHPSLIAMSAVENLGGDLAIVADELTVSGAIEMPSGTVTLKTVGSDGDLVLTSDASVLAGGSGTEFNGVDAYTPGGTVVLVSEGGNVIVEAGSMVDVSSAGNDAGLIKVVAGDKAVLLGNLKAEAGGDGLGGRFHLDAANANTDTASSGNNFSALNSVLEAGGFRGERLIRLRQGDVIIEAPDTVKTGRFVLTAESGKVDIHGTVDASGSEAGDIAIHAEGDVTLYSGSVLSAAASGQNEDGGRVFLSTDSGSLAVNTGSTVTVAGGPGGEGGLLHLRARRNAGNNDLAITALSGDIADAKAIRVEGYKAYSDASIASTDFGTGATPSTSWHNEAKSFMAFLPAIRNRLGMDGNDAFRLAPGIEVQSAGDLTLSSDWTLHAWRYDPETGAVASSGQLESGLNVSGKPLLAGVLTLRSSGNLNINGSLSDGFSTAATSGVVQGLESWSYRLIAGADLVSANPLGLLADDALAANKGNLTIASNKLVRTGTGSIDIAVAGDMTLGNDGSVIYTAGRKADDSTSLPGFTPPTSNLKPYYLTQGGDINVLVRGDIEGKVATGSSQQLITNWLYRQGGGTSSKDVTWWVRPDLFRQNLGALGGGDIRVEAGGSIRNFSAVIPTSGRVPYKDAGLVAINGGGDLLVRAGGDILSGVYMLGQGNGYLIAGGSVDDADGARGNKNSANFGTTLALQDGTFTVSAGEDAFIQTVFNPTLWAQATSNASSIDRTGLASYFNTYAQGSGAVIESLRGDVVFGSPDKDTVVNKVRTGTNASALFNSDSLFIQPGSMSAIAHRGDVKVSQMTMTPDPMGNLKLLANNDLVLIYQDPAYSGIYMSDADTALMATLSSPKFGLKPSGSQGELSILRDTHALIPVHMNDAEPVRLVARSGSISYEFDKGTSTATDPGGYPVVLPKQARVVAGQDIFGLSLFIQHLSAGDQTTLLAGRDLGFGATASVKERIEVAGPGELLIETGRHIDLAASGGILSVANSTNPNLEGASGSNITLVAGLGQSGADINTYVGQYIDPVGSGPVALDGDAEALGNYRQETADSLTAFMRKITGNEYLSELESLLQFMALDASRQAPFVYRHMSSELLKSGKEAAQGLGHERGYDAVAVLFPGSDYFGDLSMYNSQVRTLRTADIDILVPGGVANAGLPGSATGADIGIVTERGGEIRSFSDQGFLVNQSKVITQFASDILVWVSNGDIDAGRGSQTAVSVPRKTVLTNKDGYTTVEYNGVATGSGIRAQTYDPDGPNGSIVAPDLKNVNVALLAPRGILNASEAGIAAGNLLIIAQQVLGQENIKVEGSVSGVSLDASSIAAPSPPSLSDAGKVTEEATKLLADASEKSEQSAKEAKQILASFKPSFITVEILGFGSEGGDAGSDEEEEEEEKRRRRN